MLIMLCSEGQAQTTGENIRDDARDAAHVSWMMLRAPLRGDAQDYLIAGGIIVAVAGLSSLDRTVRTAARNNNPSWAETVSSVGKTWGGAEATGVVFVGSYGIGLISRSQSLRRIGLETAESFLLAGLGSQIIKHTLGRDRPYVENGPYHFVGPNLDNKHQSFPSGDTETAFALSSVLAAESGSVPAGVIFYSLAAATAFQRIHRDKHWLSDTVGGAVLGTAVGWGVIHYHRKLKNSGVHSSVLPGALGIRLSIEWN